MNQYHFIVFQRNPFVDEKTILITGANGFVGYALCKALSTAGYRVLGAVRKATTSTRPINWEIVEVGDFSQNFQWNSILLGVHTVIHAAGRVHQMKETSENSDALHQRVNTHATLMIDTKKS